jgi:hypothetical protein
MFRQHQLPRLGDGIKRSKQEFWRLLSADLARICNALGGDRAAMVGRAANLNLFKIVGLLNVPL